MLEVDKVDVPPELLRSALEHRPAGDGARGDGASGGPGAPAPLRLPLGPGALVGEGPVDRGTRFQREGGDRQGQADVPQRDRPAALHRSRRRLLRVGPGRQRGPDPTQAALVLPGISRLRPAPHRRSLGAVATSRRRVCDASSHLHDPHHRRERGRRPRPRPHAGADRRGGPRGVAVSRATRPLASSSRLIRPAPPEALETFRVSTRLNDAREEGPDLGEPIAGEEPGEAEQPGDARCSDRPAGVPGIALSTELVGPARTVSRARAVRPAAPARSAGASRAPCG